MPALIRALKDHGRRGLATQLAELVAARCPAPTGQACLTPVPLTPDRMRTRGFNQAELIGNRLAASWGLPLVRPLIRIRDDPPQRGASATDRAANVRGAFAVRAGCSVPDLVWLVDDVCTTGATLSACARTLRRAGARWVGAVCVARVLRQV